MTAVTELTACPPWLQADWLNLHARHSRRQMPHALLITGMAGMGKRLFAHFLAESLLCRRITEQQGACGECESCRQLMADSHPDYRQLDPEGASAMVKVDAVRELVDWLQLTARQDSYRVSLIDRAERMNHQAANCLLKTLEEPADAAIQILVADRPGLLPATVRSRCQTITLRPGNTPAALDWLTGQVPEPEVSLQRARGAPLLAMAAHEGGRDAQELVLLNAWQDLMLHRASVGRIVGTLADQPTTECLQAFCRWTAMALKGQRGLPPGADPATTEVISQIQKQLNYEQWFTIYDRLLQLNRSDSASFKTQAVLEGLFADIRLMIQG